MRHILTVPICSILRIKTVAAGISIEIGGHGSFQHGLDGAAVAAMKALKDWNNTSDAQVMATCEYIIMLHD